MKKKRRKENIISWLIKFRLLGLVVLIILLTYSIIAWEIDVKETNESVSNESKTAVEILVRDVEQSIRNSEFVVSELISHIKDGLSVEGRESQLQFVVENYPAVQSIVFMNRDFIITDIFSLEATRQEKGDKYDTDENNDDIADIVIPIYKNEYLLGFAVLKVDILNQIKSTSEYKSEDYSLVLLKNNVVISESNGTERKFEKLSSQATITIDDKNTFVIKLVPTNVKMKSVNRTARQWLIISIVFSFIISILVFFIQRSIQKARELNESQKKITIANKEITKQNSLMKEHLRDKQKLESIGILASGVAHEINNPINGIMNYGQIIVDSNEQESDTSKFANEIIHETNRVSNLVHDLLNYSRMKKDEYSLYDPKDIIKHTLSLVKTILKKDQIEIITEASEYLSRIQCNGQQIQQVLINLLTNARDGECVKISDSMIREYNSHIRRNYHAETKESIRRRLQNQCG